MRPADTLFPFPALTIAMLMTFLFLSECAATAGSSPASLLSVAYSVICRRRQDRQTPLMRRYDLG